MFRKILCLLLATSSLSRADERSAEEWKKDLQASYARLSGFTATYRAQAPSKALEVKMGLDEMSGLCALHVMMSAKDGETAEIKQWTTENDQFFVDSGKEGRVVMTGVRTEMKSLCDLLTLLGIDPKEAATWVSGLSTPSMLLDQTGISPAVALVARDKPTWLDVLQDATVKEAGEKSVTFQTKDIGTLEISREHGMLLKQTMQPDQGNAVVLELVELGLNPGSEGVAKISAGWKGDDAKVIARGSTLGPARIKVFQLLIEGVETGRADLDKLGKQLEEQREPLRRFADGFSAEVGGSLASEEVWKKILADGRGLAEVHYRKEHPDATKEQLGKLVDAFLGSAPNRVTIRDGMAKLMATKKELRQRLLFEMGGKNRKVKLLTAKDEAGEAAKEMIEIALFQAYAEAVLDKKMRQYWSEREGLE